VDDQEFASYNLLLLLNSRNFSFCVYGYGGGGDDCFINVDSATSGCYVTWAEVFQLCGGCSGKSLVLE